MPSTEEPENQAIARTPRKADWVHLPEDTRVISLWGSLHDGELVAVRSDLFARTVILQFEVLHFKNFSGLADDCCFSFVFANVTSVRATRWSRWPGQFEIPKGTPQAEQSRLGEEYQAKWREESDSWLSFEERLSSDEMPDLEISNADLAVAGGAASLRLVIESEDQGFQVLTIAAEELRIRHKGDVELSLEAFISLGEDYWTAFACRSA